MGFGYRINYDKAIAYDLRQIEEMTRLLELDLLCPEDQVGQWYGVTEAVLTRPDLARRLGFTAPELAVASETEPSDWPLSWTLTLERDFDQRCEALCDDDEHLPTESEAKAGLKKAKTDLARHRRNKKKNGGGQ